jgi:hypothetical protein
VNAEVTALKDALDGEREHVLGILEGLSEQDPRRPVLPTGWNCLELDLRDWFAAGLAAVRGVNYSVGQ